MVNIFKQSFHNKDLLKVTQHNLCYKVYFVMVLLILPPFSSSVLEPGFDLGISHLQRFGQSRSFCRSQVLLLVKPFF